MSDERPDDFFIVTYEGREWGYFTEAELADMHLTRESPNVRVRRSCDTWRDMGSGIRRPETI